ncbi:MAG TPA: hypothetical protein VN040_14245 [Pseudosphingobacterium sp.]|nr:hypothetical protein [Pseudosphingobacterium sp.]
MEHKKPHGFEDYLAAYGPLGYDSHCGEPFAWGFKIVGHLGEELFQKLCSVARVEYIGGTYGVICKILTREKATKLYGEVTEEVFGPKGGWKSVTFGNKTFVNRYMKQYKG